MEKIVKNKVKKEMTLSNHQSKKKLPIFKDVLFDFLFAILCYFLFYWIVRLAEIRIPPILIWLIGLIGILVCYSIFMFMYIGINSLKKIVEKDDKIEVFLSIVGSIFLILGIYFLSHDTMKIVIVLNFFDYILWSIPYILIIFGLIGMSFGVIPIIFNRDFDYAYWYGWIIFGMILLAFPFLLDIKRHIYIFLFPGGIALAIGTLYLINIRDIYKLILLSLLGVYFVLAILFLHNILIELFPQASGLSFILFLLGLLLIYTVIVRIKAMAEIREENKFR